MVVFMYGIIIIIIKIKSHFQIFNQSNALYDNFIFDRFQQGSN